MNLGRAGSLERDQPTPGLAKRWGATTVETRKRVDRGEARERTGGDGRPADHGGESPGEDENQEGIGPLHRSKPEVQRTGFPEGAKP